MMFSLSDFSFDSATGVIASEASTLGYKPGVAPGKSIYIHSPHTGRTAHFVSTGYNGAGWTFIPSNAKNNKVLEVIIFND